MEQDTITIKVPARAEHVGLLRTTVGGLARRDSFTIEQASELELAVDEAVAHLLRVANGGSLTVSATVSDAGLQVRILAPTSTPSSPIDESSFSWLVLESLTDELEMETVSAGTAIVLTKQRTVAREPSADAPEESST